MIVFVVLVLMAVLLTLSCFIYCRMRDRNKVATFQKFREPEATHQRGTARLLIKNGNNTIIKTTGLADDKLFFHDN